MMKKWRLYVGLLVFFGLVFVSMMMIDIPGMSWDAGYVMGTSLPEEVWSDNFDDGNYDGWNTFGLNITMEGVFLTSGNFTVTDGVLRCGGAGYNVANHASSLVYGIWAFDIFVVIGPHEHSAVYLTKEGWTLEDGVENGYAIAFAQSTYSVSEPGIHIAKSTDYHSTWHEYWLTPVNNRWFHVEVIHLLDGTFNVFINGTLRISYVDNSLTSSSLFEFTLEPGCAVDNVVVSSLGDTGLIPPNLPLLLVVGVSIVIIIIVIAVYLKKRR